jgi:hypothetical protein
MGFRSRPFAVVVFVLMASFCIRTLANTKKTESLASYAKYLQIRAAGSVQRMRINRDIDDR